jgi:ADP-ribosyl-[dinitrogen reductase] hydrolase
VNHDGDSDSTGSMTGQLLGVRFGAGVIPERWVAGVELREVVERVAGDLVTGFDDGTEWWGRWPGF